MNQTQFKVKVIDKGRSESILYDFRIIEERLSILQKEQKHIENRQLDWNNNMERLWGEINRLKEKLK